MSDEKEREVEEEAVEEMTDEQRELDEEVRSLDRQRQQEKEAIALDRMQRRAAEKSSGAALQLCRASLERSISPSTIRDIVDSLPPRLIISTGAVKVEIARSDLFQLLDSVNALDEEGTRIFHQGPVFRAATAAKPWVIRLVLIAFLRKFFREIRDHICADHQKSKSGVSAATAAAITSLSTFIARMMDVDQQLATVLTAALLGYIVTGTRGTFCAMTEEEAVSALMANVPPEKPGAEQTPPEWDDFKH